jgi:hypothetical protein
VMITATDLVLHQFDSFSFKFDPRFTYCHHRSSARFGWLPQSELGSFVLLLVLLLKFSLLL